jgi:chitin disaccharide deacetylase
MGCAESGRRLIVNADDFGRSHSINQAVVQAHQEGILTTASLMVNGDSFNDAVALARQNPQLGVGLHLTLLCGSSTLAHDSIPGLVGPNGMFADSAVTGGMRYFFQRSLRSQLERELRAQFAKFAGTGLLLDHVNGHLNIHLHPTVFALLMANASEWRSSGFRLTQDPLRVNLRLARGRWLYRLSHWLIFGLLSWRSRVALRRHQIRHTRRVFGLLQNSCVDEQYVLGLLRRLPPGDSELYSHPCVDKFKPELDALISPKARQLVRDNGIELIRYEDL